jgi:hypothetical protein
MKTQLVTALAVWLLLGAGAARSDEKTEAKALLDRATKAMNDEGKLAKYRTGTLKGKLTVPDGGGDVIVTFDGTWQGLGQYRVDANLQEGGRTFQAALGINGEKAWFKKGEKMDEGPEGVVPFLHNIFHAGRMPALLPSLTDKEYTLSLLGEVKVGNRTAVGLTVSHKDRKDVSLLFDKENGLPLKSEVRLTDPKGKEITVEYLYADYKDFDGVKLPAEVTIKFADTEATLEVSEVKPADKAPDGLFDKP